MRLLTIGGTVFLGRHLVEAALRRGHDVTVFTRGRQNPRLFPGAVSITGDRRRDLSRLTGRPYDAVFDTCGYLPADVRASARALRASTPFYVYISSITAYSDQSAAGAREDAPVHAGPPASTQVTGATLGPLKAACERAVLDHYGPAGSLIARCGRIVGPHDVASRSRVDGNGEPLEAVDYDAFAGRLPYWPLRAASGAEFIAPEPSDQPLQLLDVRDLADWLVSVSESRQGGTFNVTGPVDGQLTMADLIRACTQVAGVPDQNAIWVAEEFLLDHGIRPGTGLPLWTPRRATARRGHYAVDVGAARRAGLRSRPLTETMADVLAWARAHPRLAVASATPVLSRSREEQLLAQWRHATSTQEARP